MTTFLNTGVLGQQTGGTLGTGGLRDEFTSFRERVLAGKKTTRRNRRRIEETRPAEVKAVAANRDEQVEQSKETTGLADGVITSDVKPINLPGDDPDVQAVTKALGITKTEGAKPATKTDVAPEFKYSSEQGAFVQQMTNWSAHIGGKNASDIGGGRAQTQGFLGDLVGAAKATGDERLINAVGGITGILGENHISAGNVGTAKASTMAAQAAVRDFLDLERIQADITEKGTTFQTKPRVTAGSAVGAISRVARGGFGSATSGNRSNRSGNRFGVE